MQTEKPDCYHPVCLFAHDMVNSLTVIIGRCDLAMEAGRSDDERDKNLKQLRDIAKSMCDRLQNHLCQPDFPVHIYSQEAVREPHASDATQLPSGQKPRQENSRG